MASMNLQQSGHPKSLANGYGRQRVGKETVVRSEHKSQSGKTNVSKMTNAGVAGNKGGHESPLHERLLYLSTCLIGHSVEVQVKDGSLFSGIFHAINAEKDLGIILKMAREIKTSSSKWQKPFVDPFSKAPSKTLIIPYKELVQMTAKDVSVTMEDFEDDIQCAKQQEIMLDSSISQHRHVDAGRELERWVPDEDDLQCPELDNIFDGPWKRGWDQFEANEALFGVKSTFDEDLYTTKLERGPHMRELEREAMRIAREIEGEETQDLHLAEERGAQFPEHFDIDEETKYSSVYRGADDSGYDEDEDILLNSQNIETFGDASSSVLNKSFANLTNKNNSVGAQVASCLTSMEEQQSSKSSTAGDTHRFDINDNNGHLSSQLLSDSSATRSESSIQENQFNEPHGGSICVEEFGEKIQLTEEAQTSKTKDLPSSLKAMTSGSYTAGSSPNYTSNLSTSQGSNKAQVKISSPSDWTGNSTTVKAQGAKSSLKTHERPGSSTSSTSESGRRITSTPKGPALSPSSSLGSLSSEKSTLNPHAKEFKLNPNAKSFVPSQSPLRPASPVSDSSFYVPPNVPSLPHMRMPVGIGVGASYSPQPIVYNPQVQPMQSPQGYFHPNGPQYGQQMILGHPPQLIYMPAYSPEMQFRGRDF